ncbi:uncharacterized protein BT62DRAFT_275787 [Guyanagaster necrorhizus]|uniref:Uncharacterized protein n=1 Tax=Guyanagaster necrorhizus TaxID=856835 RepID=A0A9P7W3Z4_9AGAR|nr:uncharacterized protein BT62DRAFT_275787 [Guyanagaster necrorhizus MCA 3950]KAG7452005.1 hypothetical protein BT62DRAFT_275787 [Guyanagaster necrorhizus MCA 3950]
MTGPRLEPSYAPAGESAADLLVERSNLNGMALSLVAYGILFTMAIQCYSGLLSMRARRGTTQWWLWIYVTTVLALATVAIGGNQKFTEMTYIDYRDYPGGPNAFTTDFYATPINLMCFIYVSLGWFADGLVLYRFFVIYNRSIWVALVPAVLFLAGIGTSTGLVVSIAKSEESFWANSSVHFGIAYWTISVSLNVIFTCLIITRLLIIRRQVKAIIGSSHGTHYTSIVAILVESASLYSGWALVFLITYARNSWVQNILLPPLGQIQGIAPLLIIMRVVSGRAWSKSTDFNTSSMQFTPASYQRSGPTNLVPLNHLSSCSHWTTETSAIPTISNESDVYKPVPASNQDVEARAR